MAALTLLLLGPMQVRRDRVTVTEFETDAARALLAYLTLNPQRPTPRSTLAGLLWPEWTESEALHNLRNALYRLRIALGDHDADPPFLRITRTTLQLNPDADVWVDVAAFAAAVTATERHAHPSLTYCDVCSRRLAEAAELYRDDLLAGFDYPSAAFESWLVTEREALHVQAMTVMDQLTTCHLAMRRYGEATAVARRQVALEPWRETAHRQLMEALALSGRRAEAVAQYRMCRETLTAELGIEPDVTTVALHERIRQGELAPPTGAVTSEAPRAESTEPPRSQDAVRGPSEAFGDTAALHSPDAASRPTSQLQETPPWADRHGSRAGPMGDSLLQSEPLVGGERRITSLLVAQVAGASDLLERAGLEAWAEAMHDLRSGLRLVAERYEGTLIQTPNVGLVAVFGAQVTHEDDVTRAVLAALALMQAFEVTRPSSPLAEGAAALTLQVGVITGEAVVMSEEAEGPAVHAAALAEAGSVQAHVPPGTVWVTDATYQRVEAHFDWAWLGEVPGVGSLYRPLSPTTAPAEHAVGGLRAPLVGREAELHALMSAITRVGTGIGGIVTVVGEAGIGKSRLVAEARSPVFRPESSVNDISSGDAAGKFEYGAVRWVEGRWASYAEGIAYSGWQVLLRELLQLPDSCTRESCVGFQQQVVALCTGRAEVLYPYLARLLALPVDAAMAAQLDGMLAAGLLQEAIFQAVADLLTCVATQTPVMVVLEDLHWADASSLELLDFLMPLTDRVPLLLVVVMRPRRAHGSWRVREQVIRDYGHRHTDLQLRPLSVEESDLLVRHLMEAAGRNAESDGAWLSQVQRRAEGNPFFTAEIVRSLLDQEAGAEALPATVQGVLMERMDRLPVAARQVLQLAAVVGRTFRYRLLADIVTGQGKGGEAGSAALDTALLRLVQAQMIREQARDPARVYTFEHQLTLEAAYGNLLRRKRRSLHRRVAEALERLYPEEIETRLAVLAHHWSAAGDRDRAVTYLRRAAEQALAQYAMEEAVIHLTQALALVPEEDAAARFDLLLLREHALSGIGEQAAQSRDRDELKALADRLEDPRRQAEVLLREANRLTWHMDEAAALERGQAALDLAREAGDAALEARAHLAQGGALIHRWASARSQPSLSLVQEAHRHFDRARTLAHGAGRRDLEADSLSALGNLLMHYDRVDAAITSLNQAVSLYRQLHHPHEVHAIGHLIYCWNAKGELAKARSYADDRLRAARRMGLPRPLMAPIELDAALMAFHHGEYQRALTLAQAGLKTYRLYAGGTSALPAALRVLGLQWLSLGAYDRARDVYDELALLSEEMEDAHHRIVASREQARLDFYAGGLTDALKRANHAVEIALGLGERGGFAGLRTELICAFMVKGYVLLGLNRLDDAAAAFHQALDRRHPTLKQIMALEPQVGLARVALARDDLDEALSHITPLLDLVGTPLVDSAMEPALLYLTCYRVLAALGDPRAREVLETGYRWLMDRADLIEDEALHRSFLQTVSSNRELSETYKVIEADKGDV